MYGQYDPTPINMTPTCESSDEEERPPRGCLRKCGICCRECDCPPHFLIKKDLVLSYNGRTTYQPIGVTIFVAILFLFLVCIFGYNLQFFNLPFKMEESETQLSSIDFDKVSNLQDRSSGFKYDTAIYISFEDQVNNASEFCSKVIWNEDISRLEKCEHGAGRQD